jgi:type IV pilus assembly protein PilA
MQTSPFTPTYRVGRRYNAGFTLVELMIVVAIIGVLAALATVGYRKYIDGAKITEPLSMIQSIRSAEESMRAETMSYLDVSTPGSFYPSKTFSSKKTSWDMAAHSDYARWRTLGVTADGPVRFGYTVNAGPAGGVMTPVVVPYLNGAAAPPAWPQPTLEPWYVIQSQGDPDEDGNVTTLIASSLSNDIWRYNE